MTGARNLSRRAMLAGTASLAVGGTQACGQARPDRTGKGSRRLIAYFTRSGNTRVIAGTIARELDADLFEIRPERPYPDDYEDTVAQATRERDAGTVPELAERVTDMAAYDEIYLGFPIWGETAPPIIRSFLTAHDLRAKRICPFITHGGYGVGQSLAVLNRYADGAHIERPFVMEADQERRTMTQVRSWLADREGDKQ